MSEQRIVSLIASATEIVCALGLEDQLVGRSHECDFPPSVQCLPICTAPKFDVEGSSYEIEERVKGILQEGLSVYRVDGDKLRALEPTAILTQTQCEVCAVSLRDVEAALCSWIGSRPQIVSLAPNALADVWKDIHLVGSALGVPGRAEELIGNLQRRMTVIAGRAKPLPRKPTVACIEWIDPLMASGNWIPELVEMAGGINLFGAAGKHAPWLSWSEVCDKEPDILLILPCGFDIRRTRSELPLLQQRPEWPLLRAVREQRVYVTDGNQYFNRPGPRLVESLEILAELFHPELFHFGHEQTGWQRL